MFTVQCTQGFQISPQGGLVAGGDSTDRYSKTVGTRLVLCKVDETENRQIPERIRRSDVVDGAFNMCLIILRLTRIPKPLIIMPGAIVIEIASMPLVNTNQ